MKITGGTGAGYQAAVSSTNRLLTSGVADSESVFAAEQGDAYNINTGLISMSANGTLLYIKNNEDKDLVVDSIAIGSFEGITHSDDPYITIVRNPTGGDLISDASAVSMNQNRNFGSARTLTADVYKGKSGGTLTGGNNLAILQVNPGTRNFYGINLDLPKGSELGISLTANVTSGSANYYCAAICYLKTVRVET